MRNLEKLGIMSSVILTIIAVSFSSTHFEFVELTFLQMLNITSNDEISELGIKLSIVAISLTITIFIFQTKLSLDQHRIMKSKDKFEREQIQELQPHIEKILFNINNKITNIKNSTELWKIADEDNKKNEKRFVMLEYENTIKHIQSLQSIDFLSNSLLPQNIKSMFKELADHKKGPILDDHTNKANLTEVIQIETQIKKINDNLTKPPFLQK